MLAFLRVVLFYLGFSALLIWGMFALGLADALELPGFEGARAPAGAPALPGAVRSVPEVSRPETIRSETTKSEPLVREPVEVGRQPAPEPAREAKRVVVDVPPPAPPVVVPAAPAARTEVAAAAPVADAQLPVETPRASLQVQQPPSPPPSPPSSRMERKDPDPVARMAPSNPPAPPRQSATNAPVVVVPPVAGPPRVVDAAPVGPPLVTAPKTSSQTRAPAAASPQPGAWAPVHRIAGFGAVGLAELLADKRRARDDIACVMFRNIVFKGGTTIYRPGARADLEQVAKVLNANPGQRVELGSRLGPGRPMSTDAKLRADRAQLVRNTLISLGVAPARLAIDTREAYESVAEDVGRIDGGRIQSMGICILPS